MFIGLSVYLDGSQVSNFVHVLLSLPSLAYPDTLFPVSYPVEVILRMITRFNPYRKAPLGPRPKRASVERVGVSISCRYTPSTGFFFRVTPWLFILPGIQLIAKLMARLFFYILGRMEQFEDERVNHRAAVAAAAAQQNVRMAVTDGATTTTVAADGAGSTIIRPINTKPLPVKSFKVSE